MLENMMQPPQKVAPNDLEPMIDRWLEAHAVKMGPDQHVHKCSTKGPIRYYRAFMSHHTPFPGGDDECAGSGRVTQITLPVCTVCVPEVPPDGHGCIHFRDYYGKPKKKSLLQRIKERFFNK